jgi:Tol biopolymer transport system component
MRRWAVSIPLTLLLVQCGGGDPAADDPDLVLPDRVDSIDSGKPANDGSRDAPPPTDSSLVDAPAPACDPTKPFGTPVRMAEFDAAGHRSTPRLAADELTIYFTTNVGVDPPDLAMATRASKGAPFSNQTILPQSGPSNDHDPAVGADDLSLWFHSGRNGTADIFLSTRASKGMPFGAAVAIPTVNQATTNENHAYFRAAANELWFISDRPGGAGGFDIYVSARNGTAFGAPTRIAELASPTADWQPQPSEDGKTILFASDRPGGKGLLDLWTATRADASAPFATPAPITELGSPNVDQAGWLSADRCRIWFSSGRNTADAYQQLFFAERPF